MKTTLKILIACTCIISFSACEKDELPKVELHLAEINYYYGEKDTFIYDINMRLIEHRNYVDWLDEKGDLSLLYTDMYFYNSENKIFRMENYDRFGKLDDIEEYEYDNNGRYIQMTTLYRDSLGNEFSFRYYQIEYSSNGNISSFGDYQVKWDGNGNVTKVIYDDPPDVEENYYDFDDAVNPWSTLNLPFKAYSSIYTNNNNYGRIEMIDLDPDDSYDWGYSEEYLTYEYNNYNYPVKIFTSDGIVQFKYVETL